MESADAGVTKSKPGTAGSETEVLVMSNTVGVSSHSAVKSPTTKQVWRLTEKELSSVDPLSFARTHSADLAAYGVVKVQPPRSLIQKARSSSAFKEQEKLSPEVQYVARLYRRWGPNTRVWLLLQRHLMQSQAAELTEAPTVCGLEVDLPGLLTSLEACGGVDVVMARKRWDKVAEHMGAPRALRQRLADRAPVSPAWCHRCSHLQPIF